MDWNLFWSAFVAIGTTVGSLTTAIAVVVAVIQYKQPLTKRVKVDLNTAIPVYENKAGEFYLCISVANTGVRTIYISNIYLCAGKKKIVINNLMQDLSKPGLHVEFPKELLPEMCFNVYISCQKLSDEFTNLINQKTISPNQKIKILATDTTSGEYYCKKTFEAKNVSKMK